MLKPQPGISPCFSTRQPLILPFKPPAQLLSFCTFQYLYTALELKPSLTLTLWLNCSSLHSQYLYMALELKPSLTLTLTLWPSATYCKRRIGTSQCNLLLMLNRAFPVQPTANDGERVKIFALRNDNVYNCHITAKELV